MGVLPVIDEPQHQVSLDDGIFQTETVPREQVHATPLTALDILPPQIWAEDVQVLKAYCFILNHQMPCRLLLGCDVVSQSQFLKFFFAHLLAVQTHAFHLKRSVFLDGDSHEQVVTSVGMILEVH